MKPGLVIALSLLAAGGIGNVVDRVIFGYVVDFIEFNFIEFPVFNVADICVTVGVILLFIQVLFFGGVSAGSEPAGDELNGAGGESAASESLAGVLNGAGNEPAANESVASELNGAGNEPAANESVASELNGAGNEPAASEFASKVAAEIAPSDANKAAGERGVRQENGLQAGALQKDESQQSGCGVRQKNQEKLATQKEAGDKSAARGRRD